MRKKVLSIILILVFASSMPVVATDFEDAPAGALFYEDMDGTIVWWHEYPTDEMRELLQSAMSAARYFSETASLTEWLETSESSSEPLNLCILCPLRSETLGTWTDWLQIAEDIGIL